MSVNQDKTSQQLAQFRFDQFSCIHSVVVCVVVTDVGAFIPEPESRNWNLNSKNSTPVRTHTYIMCLGYLGVLYLETNCDDVMQVVRW